MPTEASEQRMFSIEIGYLNLGREGINIGSLVVVWLT